MILYVICLVYDYTVTIIEQWIEIWLTQIENGACKKIVIYSKDIILCSLCVSFSLFESLSLFGSLSLFSSLSVSLCLSLPLSVSVSLSLFFSLFSLFVSSLPFCILFLSLPHPLLFYSMFLNLNNRNIFKKV